MLVGSIGLAVHGLLEEKNWLWMHLFFFSPDVGTRAPIPTCIPALPSKKKKKTVYVRVLNY